jgi:hypothetical protein
MKTAKRIGLALATEIVRSEKIPELLETVLDEREFMVLKAHLSGDTLENMWSNLRIRPAVAFGLKRLAVNKIMGSQLQAGKGEQDETSTE